VGGGARRGSGAGGRGADDAVRLWDHVTALAGFPGFAELKRSLRERPQLRSFGVDPGTAGTEEDWHAGLHDAGV
jgi:hypothetical protein